MPRSSRVFFFDSGKSPLSGSGPDRQFPRLTWPGPPRSGRLLATLFAAMWKIRSGLFARSRLDRAWPNRQNERCPAASRRLGLSSRYKVKDANCQALAYVYARETRAGADIANVLTMDEARGVASNIAKLPSYSLARIRRFVEEADIYGSFP